MNCNNLITAKTAHFPQFVTVILVFPVCGFNVHLRITMKYEYLKSPEFIFSIFRERIYKCNVVRCAAQEKLIARLGYWKQSSPSRSDGRRQRRLVPCLINWLSRCTNKYAVHLSKLRRRSRNLRCRFLRWLEIKCQFRNLSRREKVRVKTRYIRNLCILIELSVYIPSARKLWCNVQFSIDSYANLCIIIHKFVWTTTRVIKTVECFHIKNNMDI